MGMTEQLFRNSIEARELVSTLRIQLDRMLYNPDLRRYCDNLGKMGSALSPVEVGPAGLKSMTAKLAKAVAHLQHLILIYLLMN